MSSYKLKKWYPSLPKDWEIDMEVRLIGDAKNNIYNTCDSRYTSNYRYCFEVENNPEFWEKVVEKDYEILSFTNHTGQISTKRKNGLFLNSICTNGSGVYTEEHHLNKWDIQSVKRLSDGSIWTIGEKTTDGIITKFEILDGVLIVFIYDVTWFKLDLLEKLKQPLFKTEDGVDIFQGDKVHWVVTRDYRYLYYIPFVSTHLESCFSKDGVYKVFSTKEVADEWILMNKPCLSIKEIAPIFGMYYLDNSKTSLDRLSEKLKELVKGKI